jgi:hypothetical protein
MWMKAIRLRLPIRRSVVSQREKSKGTFWLGCWPGPGNPDADLEDDAAAAEEIGGVVPCEVVARG